MEYQFLAFKKIETYESIKRDVTCVLIDLKISITKRTSMMMLKGVYEAIFAKTMTTHSRTCLFQPFKTYWTIEIM